MIDLIAAAGIGVIIGGLVAWQAMKRQVINARSTAEKLLAPGLFSLRCDVDLWRGMAQGYHAAHTRCADALTTKERKLSSIRDLLDKPRTIRKGELAAILDGDV